MYRVGTRLLLQIYFPAVEADWSASKFSRFTRLPTTQQSSIALSFHFPCIFPCLLSLFLPLCQYSQTSPPFPFCLLSNVHFRAVPPSIFIRRNRKRGRSRSFYLCSRYLGLMYRCLEDSIGIRLPRFPSAIAPKYLFVRMDNSFEEIFINVNAYISFSLIISKVVDVSTIHCS